MNFYRTEQKLFLRSIYLPAIFLIVFFFYQYHHISYILDHISMISSDEALIAVFHSNDNLFFLFIAMIFMGYELQRRYITQFPKELIIRQSTAVTILSAKIVVLAALSLILFCSAIPYDIFIVTRIQKLTAPILVNIVCANLLSYLLIPFVAGVVGLALGSLCKRPVGYAVLAVLSLTLFQIFTQDVSPLTGSTPLREFIGKLFSFFPSAQIQTPSSLYGIPVEKYRWLLLLFWFSLAAGVLLYKVWNKRWIKIAALTCCCILAVFSFYGSILDPGTIRSRTEDKLNIYYTSDQINRFYTESKGLSVDEETSFSVTRCEGSLSITDRLTADLTLFVDKNQASYPFTLYPGFTVSSISDENGNPVPFTRIGQIVLVTPEQSTASFRFTYSGGSSCNFANTQAVYLPGSFSYYPTAGFRWLNSLGCGPSSQESIEFSVSVFSLCPVSSNLSQQNGRFEGTTSALTLYGGLYEYKQSDGFTEVWPSYYKSGGTFKRELLQKAITEFCNKLEIKTISLPENFTIFRTESDLIASQPTYAKGHIVEDWSRSYTDIAYRYVLTAITPDSSNFAKNAVISALVNLMGQTDYGDGELSEDLISLYSSEYGHYDLQSFVEPFLSRYAAQHGRNEMLKAVYNYLQQPQDYISTMEYLMDLCGWQEYKEGLK